jgi:hypothetical protein
VGNLLEPDRVDLCKDCPDEEVAVDAVEQAIGTTEKAKWRMNWRVDKYDGEVAYEDIARLSLKPVETVEIDGNLLTTAGIQRLEDLLIGAGGQAYNAANSRIGVGNSSTAAAVGQTDLQASAGSSNRQFKLVSSVSRSISWVATFSTSQANFNWLEFCIDNGTADGTTVVAVMLNRKVISAGTKTSAQTWVATATLVIS